MLDVPLGLNYRGPSPHGEGGLKPLGLNYRDPVGRPSPHGEGGLKPGG